jgi:hypothetical protein
MLKRAMANAAKAKEELQTERASADAQLVKQIMDLQTRTQRW